MGEIILRLGSELVVLLSLFGWGEALCARLSLRVTPFQGAAIGLGAFLVLGGLLGALGLFGHFGSTLLVAAGVLPGLFYLHRRLRGTNFSKRDLLAAQPFLAAGLLAMAAAQHGFWFSPGDDMQGYLPLIKKLSDTGLLGDSSFSEKRLFDLGGASVLQSVFVGWINVSAVNLADLGIGALLLLGLIGERVVMRRANILWSVILAAAILLLNEDGRPISPVLLIEALCLLLVLFLLEDAPLSRRHYIVWGVVAAALIALKSTALVFVGVISIGVFLLDWRARGLVQALLHGVIAAAAGLICILPYFYASAKFTGTPFFPLLGFGFQDPALGDGMMGRSQATFANVQHFILANPQLQIVLLIALGVALYALHRRDGTGLIRNLTLSALLAVSVVEIVWASFAIGDVVQAVRYTVPFFAAVLLALLLDWRVVAGAGMRGWVLAASLMVAMPYCARDPDWGHPSVGRSDLIYGWTGSFDSALALFHPFPIFPLEDGAPASARLQQAAAPGTRMLVFVNRPFQFDFARNQIETSDCAGRVSPPPGLKLDHDDVAVTTYLRGTGIRYLAYAYGDHDNYSPSLLSARVAMTEYPWTVYCARAMTRMLDFLQRARGRFHAAYDDGATVLLDLERPAGN